MPECRTNRKAASRPLGFLVQWLRQGYAYLSHEDHMASQCIIDREDRRRCRQWLQEQAPVDPSILHLLQKEAEFLGLAWEGVQTVTD